MNYIAIILIGVILLAILIPWLINYKNKNDKLKLSRKFDELAANERLVIEKKQSFNKRIIGLDKKNSKIIFLDGNFIPSQLQVLNLHDISDCYLQKETASSDGHISNLYLKCRFTNPQKPEISLPVYNSSTDKLYKKMRLSKKGLYWAKSINLFRDNSLS